MSYTFTNCWVRNATTGYSLTGCKYVVIENCFSDINKYLINMLNCECITLIGCATELTTTAVYAESSTHLELINLFVYASRATETTPCVGRFINCEYISIDGSYLPSQENDNTVYDIVISPVANAASYKLANNWRTNAEGLKEIKTFATTRQTTEGTEYKLDLSELLDLTSVDILGAVVTPTGQSTTGAYTTAWRIGSNKLIITASVSQIYIYGIIIFYKNKSANASS